MVSEATKRERESTAALRLTSFACSGSFEDALKVPNTFETTIPALFNLPPLRTALPSALAFLVLLFVECLSR